MKKILLTLAAAASAVSFLSAQTYPEGVLDKTVAVVGNEMISIGNIEGEIMNMRANGRYVDANARCAVLESMMENKIFLMQARIDSLTVNHDMVSSMLNDQIDRIRHALGGDEEVEKYFHKPLYKLRQDWRKQFEEQSLFQQEQNAIASSVPELTPADVKNYIEKTDKEDLPMVSEKYQLSQICIYPDKEAAKLAVKEKLLAIRERIINGEKFSTLARIYSEDTESAKKGGELGKAPKSSFWPVFSDAAMSLKPGGISNIVETPDGFHIIQVIEKEGDMFNARHILIRPQYTSVDREKAFRTLDSLRTEIMNGAVTFELAAKFYSQDPTTRTNGGQMADPMTGSSYFVVDEMKVQDYTAIKNLKEGEICEPVESLDNEGRNGNKVYKIIRVDKIIPAHPASFENDYSSMLAQAQNEAAVEAIEKFLDEKIKDTYIIIDPIFHVCEFEREGFNKIVSSSK